MTGGHVLRHGRVPAVAARAPVRGNALALKKDLDGARGQSCFDFGAGETIGHTVEVLVDLDVVIDADAAPAPLGQDIRFDGQRLEVRPVELFEQLPARRADAAQYPLLVELTQPITDREVQLGQTVEAAMAPASEQPVLDDRHDSLDLRLVARPSRAGRQNGAFALPSRHSCG